MLNLKMCPFIKGHNIHVHIWDSNLYSDKEYEPVCENVTLSKRSYSIYPFILQHESSDHPLSLALLFSPTSFCRGSS